MPFSQNCRTEIGVSATEELNLPSAPQGREHHTIRQNGLGQGGERVGVAEGAGCRKGMIGIW